MLRGNGILLGVSSLPGRYGIGTMGKEAREFLDLLSESAQKYWQILPLSPTGFGDSPYQSVSAFAGNPYYIDFEDLFEQGLLTRDEFNECEALFRTDGPDADYDMQYRSKGTILRKAFARARKDQDAIQDFQQANADWIHDYAQFMAIKATFGMKPFWEWPEELAGRDQEALSAVVRQLGEEIDYHVFVQYLFFKQWMDLKHYAEEKGIKIIGDMPIYISSDSADAWAHADILVDNGDMAGCPPDYFSRSGQLWGNPVYNWDELKSRDYDWWVARVAHHLKLFDYIRLDHFRGFESFYAIPCGSVTAEEGEWRRGPGMDFFNTLKEKLGNLPLIAEDLGLLTPEVFDLLHQTGFPGLKVLQFAFDPNAQSIYLPHKYHNNCIVYTGTHDNDTTCGWYETLDPAEKDFLCDYAGDVNQDNVHWKLIRLAMGSVADVCIIPMQDLLGLSAKARMNTPQTLGNNWKWRLKDGAFCPETVQKLKRLTYVYGR